MEYLIVIGLIALLLLNYLYFSFPKIKLVWIKLTTGKYSHSYIAKYKALTKRNPYSYCIAEDFADRLLPFYIINKKYPSYESEKINNPIVFSYSDTFTNIRKELGKPTCFQSYKISGSNIKIAGYRPEVYGKSARLYIYFVNDIFFMNEYVFKRLKDEDILSINKKTLELAGIKTEKPPKEYYINGPNKEMLFYRDTAFSQIISYASFNNTEVGSRLEKVINEITKFREKLSEEE